MNLHDLHDQMLETRPDGATHVEEECPFCQEVHRANDIAEGGTENMSKTFSEEEVQALVQAAVAKETSALTEELDKFKNSEDEKAREAEIAAVRTEADEKVADLQSKLDEAVIQAEAATKAKDEVLAWLEAEKTKAEEAEATAARKEERTASVKEAFDFSDEYVSENADRWAAMDDEAFEALVADYKEFAAKAGAPANTDTKIPTQTAMKAARENDGTGKGVPAYREVFAFRNAGMDPRSI